MYCTLGLSERPVGESRGSYHQDSLGSTVATTDASGFLTSDQRFDAFGNKGWYIPFSSTFGFAGKAQYQTDGESGLLLLGHRYYDQSVGRFISQDPAQDESNWYAYCGNNPLTGVDPTGMVPHYNGSSQQWEDYDGEIAYDETTQTWSTTDKYSNKYSTDTKLTYDNASGKWVSGGSAGPFNGDQLVAIAGAAAGAIWGATSIVGQTPVTETTKATTKILGIKVAEKITEHVVQQGASKTVAAAAGPTAAYVAGVLTLCYYGYQGGKWWADQPQNQGTIDAISRWSIVQNWPW